MTSLHPECAVAVSVQNVVMDYGGSTLALANISLNLAEGEFLSIVGPQFVIGLGLFYGQFANEPAVRHGFAGLAAAGAGLILAMAIKIAAPVRRDIPNALLAAVTFIAIALFRVPMLLAIMVMAPLGIALAWRRQR